MKQEIVKIPLKDFNNPVVVGQIITLESENFNQFLVKSINSKSVHLRKLIDIRDAIDTSTAEQKFIKLWLLLFPDISLVNQYPIEKYKADFYHIPTRTVIETHGGVWLPTSGHNTGKGVTSDCEKLCLCTSLGMKYFALTTKMINEHWLTVIAKTLRGENEYSKTIMS
ncbi:MAG TPA: hypothetical protein V6C58_02265 [Allocoleopsis sp.]